MDEIYTKIVYAYNGFSRVGEIDFEIYTYVGDVALNLY